MGVLTVRKVDDELIRRLKVRAAEKGISAEAEHRAILRDVLGDPAPAQPISAFFASSPLADGDLDGVEERGVSEPVDLS